ncbi:DUF2634 domain-containing protein [Serratia microhaemolytica]|uniref:DUF2634 domain-containing protein n=1 Tax=Serratia microhaemolytica TaxID=2675110 RepID=UPI000FDEC08A|nr:DUF2634 domain-containing protein [Serratia microhaemolytica]
MISLGLNDRGDIYLDDAGNLSITSDLPAVMQACKTAILAQRGEMIYAMDEGVPTKALVWESYRPAQFEAAVRHEILKVPGVVSILKFSVTRDGDALNYTATIETTYGNGALNGRL